jgi:hypothetical protein
MAVELLGMGKFTQSVTYHIFSDEDFNVLTAVMDTKIKTHHLGGDLGTSGPSLDNSGLDRLFTFYFF